MKITLLLLLAGSGLMAPAARGATLTYTSAYRSLESGFAALQPADPFADFDMGISGFDSRAEQRSAVSAGSIVVSSRIAGRTERAAAFFTVVFSLDEPSEWSLTGSFELLGGDGFACVSFQDLARRDTTIVNEIIFAPPVVSETRTLRFGGMLEPGNYLFEAMIYGGGDGQFTRGGIDAALTIPEPGVPLLILAALYARAWCRNVNH